MKTKIIKLDSIKNMNLNIAFKMYQESIESMEEFFEINF